MQTLRLLYESIPRLVEHLKNSALNLDATLLIRIHTTALTACDSLKLAQDIKQILPSAKIIGSSGSGIIFDRKQYDNDTLIIIEQFEHVQVSTYTNTFKDKRPQQLAQEIASQVASDTKLMHILFSDCYPEIHEFLEEFNLCASSIKLTGGAVGDIIDKCIPAFVFTDQAVIEQGVVMAAYQGEAMHTYTTANISHEPISPVYTITKTQDSHFLEIEHLPALEWFREHLGLKDFKEYADWQLIAENDDLVKFPIILENRGGASRIVKYDAKANKMGIYFSHLADNTQFRLGYSSPIKCIQECADICNQIMKMPIESIFCYTCLFRKMYMQNCAEWELRPFSGIGICGVFMMGEIAYLAGKNQLLNGSCSIVGIAETEHYIEPEFSVFEDLYNMKNDNERLLNFVLKKQSSVVSQENKLLMEKLLEQQERFREQLYVDAHTGIKNAICFTQDNLVKKFNKICMIRVENFNLLFTCLGQHGYYRFIKKIVSLFDKLIENSYGRERLCFYMLNDSTMFIASNDHVQERAFIQAASKIFDSLQFIKPDHEPEMLISRFAIVVNQQDLLEQGLLALENSKSKQSYFFVSNNSIATDTSLIQEMEILQVLNQAIKSQSIIPYFQGIYDNKHKKITCYEALMRIQDERGRIYTPAEFMDVAKKYHLYSKLSACMIAKVFDIFAARKETVSINLSVHDIKTPEMCDIIFAKLQEVGDASNFTFEILEDEEFRDVDNLKEFLAMVRFYGVKIAIDDFGSGYSNFMKLVMIEPDYIKIDGSIVKGVEQSSLHKKVLENIVFLGRQLNSSLIAEFVENSEIQQHIETMGIDFSQGYYFSKPTPYSELYLH